MYGNPAPRRVYYFGLFILAATLIFGLMQSSLMAAEPDEPSSLAELRGVVVDEADQPVTGALVRFPDLLEEKTGVTGADGAFILSVPKQRLSGMVLVAADKTGERQGVFLGACDVIKHWPKKSPDTLNVTI